MKTVPTIAGILLLAAFASSAKSQSNVVNLNVGPYGHFCGAQTGQNWTCSDIPTVVSTDGGATFQSSVMNYYTNLYNGSQLGQVYLGPALGTAYLVSGSGTNATFTGEAADGSTYTATVNLQFTYHCGTTTGRIPHRTCSWTVTGGTVVFQ